MKNNDNGKYKTLLESTQAIPWNMNWETKAFTYIGPQIEKLLGWSQDSWASAQDWIDRIHPDYREKVANYCITQSENGIDHDVDYPALTADGNYIWIREVIHVIRKDGISIELVGFMFDISERKKLEDKLLQANKKLEVYSYQDGLTGLANRRLYDKTLKSQWDAAKQSQKPISMIIADIDHFKRYNDHYGHSKGDQCLKDIADILKSLSPSATSLCTRYGGDEFIILLAETAKPDAVALAEKIREAVSDLNIPHEGSTLYDNITISVGVSTLSPSNDDMPTSLFESADKMLYQAKENNRNCVIHS